MTGLDGATCAQQLVPGRPDDLAALARQLTSFAAGADQAGRTLRGLGRDGWVGVAATAFRDQVDEIPRKLLAGAGAFDRAGAALHRHAEVLRTAQAQARQAMDLWDDAQATTRAWSKACAAHDAAVRAAGPNPGPPPPSSDPGAAGRARAAGLLDDARDAVRRSGAAVASELHAAAAHAPSEPGLLSKVLHAVGSFGKGAGEATWGLAQFAYKLSPSYLALDPQGYLDNVHGLWTGIAYGVEHPAELGRAVLDVDTWRDDPARALGHLVPDLLLTVATAGAGGAARGATALSRLERVGAAADRAAGAVFPRLSSEAASRRLVELGFDASTPSGRAARFQLDAPYGHVDDWVDEPLQARERVAFGVPGLSGFGVKVPPELTASDARTWFESLQAAPRRTSPAGPPTVRPAIEVYEVTDTVPAAQSIAVRNPQFGAGGGPQVFVPDVYDSIDRGLLTKVGRHEFDPVTTRSTIEDPRYRALDPSLPSRALDPAREVTAGRVQGAAGGLAVGAAERAGCSP